MGNHYSQGIGGRGEERIPGIQVEVCLWSSLGTGEPGGAFPNWALQSHRVRGVLAHGLQTREPLDVEPPGDVAAMHLLAPLSLSEPRDSSTNELQVKGARVPSTRERLLAGADPREFSASSGKRLLGRGCE